MGRCCGGIHRAAPDSFLTELGLVGTLQAGYLFSFSCRGTMSKCSGGPSSSLHYGFDSQWQVRDSLGPSLALGSSKLISWRTVVGVESRFWAERAVRYSGYVSCVNLSNEEI
jgi:hypothetical protein